MPEHARPTDSLFFAVFPDDTAAARIVEAAAKLRATHGLAPTATPSDRLHVTLNYLGAFQGIPSGVVQQAVDAAASVSLPPIPIALGRIETFSGRRPKHSIVLAGQADESLLALERTLHDALQVAGIDTRRHARFVPHVTLFYDERRIETHAVAPVSWLAREFALVRNRLGQSRYEILARWPLRV
jgi:RNA 2',3'-cyclic 3'-phosphodiesterase